MICISHIPCCQGYWVSMINKRYLNNSFVFSWTLYLVQSFMGLQVAMVIEVSLWLPWGPSYHNNKICGSCLLFQETCMPNISSI